MNTIRRILAALGLIRERRIGNGSAINNLESTITRFGFTAENKKNQPVNPLISLMYSKENETLFI
ncbi:MAG: hypothetical protein QG594_1261 [Bacteroidota bacterium]|jgi:hypothetical protein|nr:hypothetical protein [Bacteroidota bacterium]